MCKECHGHIFVLPSQDTLEYLFDLSPALNPFSGARLPVYVCARCYPEGWEKGNELIEAEQALRIGKGEQNV